MSTHLKHHLGLQMLCLEGNPQAFLARGEYPPNSLTIDIEQCGNVVLGQMAHGLRGLPVDQFPETLLEGSYLLGSQSSARGKLGEPLEIQGDRAMLAVELDYQSLAAGELPDMFPQGGGEVVERGCGP